MKSLTTVLTVIMMLWLGNSAMAFSWNYHDFGSSPFDYNNNTAPIDYPYGIGYLPSPGNFGEGGEKFDLEGLFVASDNDYLYVALTNSFGSVVHSSSWGTSFNQGDIFFGFTGYTDNVYALNVSTGNIDLVEAWEYIDNAAGSYYDDVTIRNRVGAFEVTQGIAQGSSDQMLTFYPGYETDPLIPDATGGDTYVYEWKIDRSLFVWDGEADLYFHTTLGCGNDLIEKTYSVIPEPATLILLGLGLIGTACFSRRR